MPRSRVCCAKTLAVKALASRRKLCPASHRFSACAELGFWCFRLQNCTELSACSTVALLQLGTARDLAAIVPALTDQPRNLVRRSGIDALRVFRSGRQSLHLNGGLERRDSRACQEQRCDAAARSHCDCALQPFFPKQPLRKISRRSENCARMTSINKKIRVVCFI